MATTTASYSTSYPSTSSSIPYPPSSSTPTTKSDPWLFNSTEIYERSPSRVDGITWPQEKELRSLGCRFIHELVTKMRRPGLPAASEAVTESAACIFFHRFFTYESFKKHHRWIIAATCVFLAFKVEEHPRHIDSVIKAYCDMRSNKTEEEFKKSRDHILTAERIVLNVLCFDLRLDHPISPCVSKFRGDLKPYLPQAREIRIDVVNKALNFLRDSAGTILCLVYPAQAIALGAVFLAVLELNCLPLDASARGHSSFSATNAAQAWYELMKNDISTEDLMAVCNQMIEVYEEWSDRKRSRQASVSAPDVSSMRRGINALSEPFDRKRSSTSQVHDPRAHSSTVPPGKRSNDKEEVNLDDPYPYDEPSSSQYSSRKTTITKSSPLVSKSILKVPVAPPTPDFQPPPTPDFQPPATPEFFPPPLTPQSHVSKRLPPSTPDFQPPQTPEFQPPPTPEFLPPPTPESSFDVMPPPSSLSTSRSSISSSKPLSRSSNSPPHLHQPPTITDQHVLSPSKRPRLQ